MKPEGRVDLHTHTFLSDGRLLPSELLRRAEALGYSALAITDHADASNLDEVVTQLTRFARLGAPAFDLAFLPGVELTHVRPVQIALLARRARQLGARLVVVHGETLVEPVLPGTNRAAVECPEVDVLAHPGLLTAEEAALASANGVALELSTRGGHNLGNGNVARVALRAGARLVVNTDTHGPGDMLDQDFARRVALGAGLTADEAHSALVSNAWQIVSRALASPLYSV